MEKEDFKKYLGNKCTKKSFSNYNYTPKPFKSGKKINTIKGLINHPQLNIPAYTFIEDDSYVECRRIQILL
jgi:hypothetical protein